MMPGAKARSSGQNSGSINRENVERTAKEKEAVSRGAPPNKSGGVSDSRVRARRTPLKLRAAKTHSLESVVHSRSRSTCHTVIERVRSTGSCEFRTSAPRTD